MATTSVTHLKLNAMTTYLDEGRIVVHGCRSTNVLHAHLSIINNVTSHQQHVLVTSSFWDACLGAEFLGVLEVEFEEGLDVIAREADRNQQQVLLTTLHHSFDRRVRRRSQPRKRSHLCA